MRRLLVAVLLLQGTLLTGCIHQFHNLEAQALTAAEGLVVATPVRAHLVSGEAIIFASGVRVSGDTLRGSGVRWSADRQTSTPVSLVPVGNVLGMESYRAEVDAGTSTLVSLLATAAITVAVPAGAIALICIADPKCFGSCPTFYVEDAPGDFTLLAEGFSYSIAPLLEMRDVDRLALGAHSDGAVRLELRNEALETHYINHVELIEAQHRAGTRVVPDARGRPVALTSFVHASRAVDRAGRDVTSRLHASDGQTYETAPAILDAAHAGDLFDTIELVFPPVQADSVAIALRMRNSLLTTVLLYEIMMADPGIRALEWQEQLQALGPAMELVRWYGERMGMHVEVLRDGAWETAGRIGDTGPIAWKELALQLPTAGDDSLRVRLRFIADQWRIDEAAIALVEAPTLRTVALAEVQEADGSGSAELRSRLHSADERYVEVLPGQRFTLRFDVGPAPIPAERTFLLVSQGFYHEWVRQGWIREARGLDTFAPNDETLAETLRRYRLMKPELEERFFSTRIPVR